MLIWVIQIIYLHLSSILGISDLSSDALLIRLRNLPTVRVAIGARVGTTPKLESKNATVDAPAVR